MSKDVKTGAPAKRSWRRFILPVSLALNLLFIGAIVGAGWMRGKHGSGYGYGGPSGFMVKHMLRHLPDEKRQSILAQITDHRKAQGSRREQMKNLAQQFKKALKQEPFNAELVRKAAKNMQNARGELIDTKMQLLVNVLAQLNPRERRKIIESRFFRRLLNRGGRRHFKQHSAGPNT